MEKKCVKEKNIKVSSYSSLKGSDEHFIVVKPSDPSAPLSEQLEEIQNLYESLLVQMGLGQKTKVFNKFFLSDSTNQLDFLLKSSLYQSASGAVSVIEQPLICGVKIAMQAYHIDFKTTVEKININFEYQAKGSATFLVRDKETGFLWSSNLCSSRYRNSPYIETLDIFCHLSEQLNSYQASLAGNVVRTWIYVRDIDRNYLDMVKARKKVFEKEGLNRDSHFIASTGIEGKSYDHSITVNMDALSILNLKEEQVEYLSAFDHMNSPHEYGVTFERGTKVKFSDRAHIYISGTASINERGDVMYLGDVLQQTKRTVQNIEALLREAKSSLDDLKALNIYVRDANNVHQVKEYISERFPSVPCVIVRAPVCRSCWLIEMDAIAIVSENHKTYSHFFA